MWTKISLTLVFATAFLGNVASFASASLFAILATSPGPSGGE